MDDAPASKFTASGGGGTAPPPTNGIDPTALAQDLLTQRRQKQQILNGNTENKQPRTLMDEFASVGVNLPGQVLISNSSELIKQQQKTAHKDEDEKEIMKGNNNNEDEEGLQKGQKMESLELSGASTPTSQHQPPEDPKMAANSTDDEQEQNNFASKQLNGSRGGNAYSHNQTPPIEL